MTLLRTALTTALALALAAPLSTADAAAPKPGKVKGRDQKGRAVFVAEPLLGSPAMPSAESVLAAYGAIAPDGPELGWVKSPDAAGPQSYRLGDDAVSVELVRESLGDDAVTDAAAVSLHGFLKDWRPEPHKAYLVVSYAPDPKRPRTKSYVDFLHVAAAVAKAAGAVGVALPMPGVLNPTDFFVDAVSQKPPLIVAHTGLRRVFERDPGADETTPPTRFGLLSSGMRDLDLPDLYFTAPIAKAGDGLEYFLDLLSYEVGLGKAPPSGDTVGRGPTEKLLVHYEDRPVDGGGSAKVWRVDLP